MSEKWPGLRLGGLIEAATVMGITKQAAARALKRGPAHLLLADLAMGPVYDLDAVEEWNMNRKRTPGPSLTESAGRATEAMQTWQETWEKANTTVTVERADRPGKPHQVPEIES